MWIPLAHLEPPELPEAGQGQLCVKPLGGFVLGSDGDNKEASNVSEELDRNLV